MQNDPLAKYTPEVEEYLKLKFKDWLLSFCDKTFYKKLQLKRLKFMKMMSKKIFGPETYADKNTYLETRIENTLKYMAETYINQNMEDLSMIK